MFSLAVFGTAKDIFCFETLNTIIISFSVTWISFTNILINFFLYLTSLISPFFNWCKKNLICSSLIFANLFFSFNNNTSVSSNSFLFSLILSFIKSTLSPFSIANNKFSIAFFDVFILFSYSFIIKFLLFSFWQISYICFAINSIFSSLSSICLHLLITRFSM